MKWTESQTCRRHGFCRSCRDPGERGTAFRSRLAREWDVEPGLFRCPHGVTLGRLPRAAGRGWGDCVAFVLARFGIKATKHCGCQRRRERLNRLGRWVVGLIAK